MPPLALNYSHSPYICMCSIFILDHQLQAKGTNEPAPSSVRANLAKSQFNSIINQALRINIFKSVLSLHNLSQGRLLVNICVKLVYFCISLLSCTKSINDQTHQKEDRGPDSKDISMLLKIQASNVYRDESIQILINVFKTCKALNSSCQQMLLWHRQMMRHTGDI